MRGVYQAFFKSIFFGGLFFLVAAAVILYFGYGEIFDFNKSAVSRLSKAENEAAGFFTERVYKVDPVSGQNVFADVEKDLRLCPIESESPAGEIVPDLDSVGRGNSETADSSGTGQSAPISSRDIAPSELLSDRRVSLSIEELISDYRIALRRHNNDPENLEKFVSVLRASSALASAYGDADTDQGSILAQRVLQGVGETEDDFTLFEGDYDANIAYAFFLNTRQNLAVSSANRTSSESERQTYFTQALEDLDRVEALALKAQQIEPQKFEAPRLIFIVEWNRRLALDISRNDSSFPSYLERACVLADENYARFPEVPKIFEDVVFCAEERVQLLRKQQQADEARALGLNTISRVDEYLDSDKAYNDDFPFGGLSEARSRIYLEIAKTYDFESTQHTEYALLAMKKLREAMSSQQFRPDTYNYEYLYGEYKSAVSKLSPEERLEEFRLTAAAFTETAERYAEAAVVSLIAGAANAAYGQELRAIDGENREAIRFLRTGIRFMRQGFGATTASAPLPVTHQAHEKYEWYGSAHSQLIRAYIDDGDIYSAEDAAYGLLADLAPYLDKFKFDFYVRQHQLGAFNRVGAALFEAKEYERAWPFIESAVYWEHGDSFQKFAVLLDNGFGGVARDAILADRIATRAANDPGMKRFTIPTLFDSTRHPFHVYIMDRPLNERDYPYCGIDDQAAWVRELRGGEVPDDVVISFRKLHRIAIENRVSFTDLTVYALGAVREQNPVLVSAQAMFDTDPRQSIQLLQDEIELLNRENQLTDEIIKEILFLQTRLLDFVLPNPDLFCGSVEDECEQPAEILGRQSDILLNAMKVIVQDDLSFEAADDAISNGYRLGRQANHLGYASAVELLDGTSALSAWAAENSDRRRMQNRVIILENDLMAAAVEYRLGERENAVTRLTQTLQLASSVSFDDPRFSSKNLQISIIHLFISLQLISLNESEAGSADPASVALASLEDVTQVLERLYLDFVSDQRRHESLSQALDQSVRLASLLSKSEPEAYRHAYKNQDLLIRLMRLNQNDYSEAELSDELLRYSWYALFSRDFEVAQRASRQSLDLQPDNNRAPYTNMAHALMFLEKTEEAYELYMRFAGQPIVEGSTKLWDDVIREDFEALQDAGLYHPLMEKVKAGFAPAPLSADLGDEVTDMPFDLGLGEIYQNNAYADGPDVNDIIPFADKRRIEALFQERFEQ